MAERIELPVGTRCELCNEELREGADVFQKKGENVWAHAFCVKHRALQDPTATIELIDNPKGPKQ